MLQFKKTNISWINEHKSLFLTYIICFKESGGRLCSTHWWQIFNLIATLSGMYHLFSCHRRLKRSWTSVPGFFTRSTSHSTVLATWPPNRIDARKYTEKHMGYLMSVTVLATHGLSHSILGYQSLKLHSIAHWNFIFLLGSHCQVISGNSSVMLTCYTNLSWRSLVTSISHLFSRCCNRPSRLVSSCSLRVFEFSELHQLCPFYSASL